MIGMGRGLLAVVMLLATIAGGSVWRAAANDDRADRLEIQIEQWREGYEYMERERKRLEKETLRWQTENRRTAASYEERIRKITRQAVPNGPGDAHCVDSVVPSPFVILLREAGDTPASPELRDGT